MEIKAWQRISIGNADGSRTYARVLIPNDRFVFNNERASKYFYAELEETGDKVTLLYSWQDIAWRFEKE